MTKCDEKPVQRPTCDYPADSIPKGGIKLFDATPEVTLISCIILVFTIQVKDYGGKYVSCEGSTARRRAVLTPGRRADGDGG